MEDRISPDGISGGMTSNGRLFERVPVKHHVTCFAIDPDTGDAIEGKIIDISRQGCGIRTTGFVCEGTSIKVMTLNNYQEFEVVWCVPLASGSNQFRCGLVLKQTFGQNLEESFRHIIN